MLAKKGRFVILFFFLVVLTSKSSIVFAKVYINRAKEKDMAKLEGVGPNKAARLVEYRDAHGPFWSLNEIKNVQGFGPNSVEMMRKKIRITPELRCWNCGRVFKVKQGAKKGTCPLCNKEWPKSRQ